MKKTTSNTADKFVVRLPDGMRDQLAERADEDCRSMNSVFVLALRAYLGGGNAAASKR